MRTFIILTALSILQAIGFAATIHVPLEQPTIQAGIAAAGPGDTVLVAPGTYVENINFLGRAITVKGSDGANDTVIDGNSSGSVVTFNSGEGVDSVLEGFTITNGTGTYLGWPTGVSSYMGGGIICQAASPTIQYNHIKNNSVSGADQDIGGGIGCYDSDVVIANNVISYNSAFNSNYYPFGGGLALVLRDSSSNAPVVVNNLITHNDAIANSSGSHCQGGGIFVQHVDAYFANNIISHNSAKDGFSFGGGLCLYESNSLFVNNTIVNNTADYRGGGFANAWGDDSSLMNSICWDNVAPLGPEVYLETSMGPPTTVFDIDYTDLENGMAGIYVYDSVLNWGPNNINSDPLFVDSANEDYHLTYPSPCRDTGDNTVVTDPFDGEGDPRIAAGTVDMGADEFYTHLYITGDQTPGGTIQGKFIGDPGTSPVRLFIGLGGVRPTPLLSPFGYVWLLPPRVSIPLVPIPVNGVLTISHTIAVAPPAPYDVPMQGLIGMSSDSLTNLCVLEVR